MARTHGLNVKGPASPFLVRLADEDKTNLETLSRMWDCPQAETIRRAIKQVLTEKAPRKVAQRQSD